MFGLTMTNQIQNNLGAEIFARVEQSRINAAHASEQQIETAVELGYNRELAVALFATEGTWLKAWKVCRDENMVNTMRNQVYNKLGYFN